MKELHFLKQEKIRHQPQSRRLGRLKNGGVPCDIWSLPKCSAKAKSTGKRCQQPAMKNGKCRFHGGKSPGAPKGKRNGNYKHGRFTQKALHKSKCLRAVARCLIGRTPPTEEQCDLALTVLGKKRKTKRIKKEPKQYWCVFQKGGGVWGIGTTKESAIRDAKYYIEGEWWLFDEHENSEATEGAYVVMPCSEALHSDVYHKGGAIRYRVVSGQVRKNARLKPGPKRKRKSGVKEKVKR